MRVHRRSAFSRSSFVNFFLSTKFNYVQKVNLLIKKRGLWERKTWINLLLYLKIFFSWQKRKGERELGFKCISTGRKKVILISTFHYAEKIPMLPEWAKEWPDAERGDGTERKWDIFKCQRSLTQRVSSRQNLHWFIILHYDFFLIISPITPPQSPDADETKC